LPYYFAGEFLGLIIGLPFAEWLFGKKTFESSICIFFFCSTESELKNKETNNEKDLQ